MRLTIARCASFRSCFFFNDTATTEIYTLSLHDALPICSCFPPRFSILPQPGRVPLWIDRKSTRLNSSHLVISYAVFCLKKKKHNILLQQESRGASSERVVEAREYPV